MRIVVNGRSMDVRDGLTLDELLGQLDVRRRFTAVAVNREVTARAAYASTRLQEGDRVEIVHPMAGG